MTTYLDRFARNFVGLSAERLFRRAVRDFCQGCGVAGLEALAQSERPLAEVIASSGFTLQPTPADRLNPWQRHLVQLSDQRLLELVREAAPLDHAAVLGRYPQLAQGIIEAVKGMVSYGGPG